MSEQPAPYLDLAVDRVVELRNLGVLQHPLGRRVFIALGVFANKIINPINGYAEEHRALAKSLFEDHTLHVRRAEAFAASILCEPIAPTAEVMSDAELIGFIELFGRRFFGLPDTPEPVP